jgi:hypothetical protein
MHLLGASLQGKTSQSLQFARKLQEKQQAPLGLTHPSGAKLSIPG